MRGMKLLLDEMLSPKLVAALAARGIYAVHIARLGRAGLSDAGLFRLAYDRDMAVVTSTRRDRTSIPHKGWRTR